MAGNRRGSGAVTAGDALYEPTSYDTRTKFGSGNRQGCRARLESDANAQRLGINTSPLRQYGRLIGQGAGLAWKAMRTERYGIRVLSLPPSCVMVVLPLYRVRRRQRAETYEACTPSPV